VALLRTQDYEELIASIITVARTVEIGTTFAVTSNRSKLRRIPIYPVICVKSKHEELTKKGIALREVSHIGASFMDIFLPAR
jgi:hypothetical protein